jgi:hypothetical protein
MFYVIVLMFVGLGQKLGAAFEGFKPLLAYTINVAGSFLAILTFTGLSLMSTSPEIWLLVGCVMTVYLYRAPLQYLLLAVSVALAFITKAPNVLWSPYYRVSVQPTYVNGNPTDPVPSFFYGYAINVNYDSIEGAYDNRPESIAKLTKKQRAELLDFYDMLYQIIGDQPKSMLILAAGAGNDLAAALRHGATYVDAVEIDPDILALGKKLHPEKPYDNPVVHAHVDDARAFMKRANRQYDVVDFAYLDSHTAFSSMSSIRLDNYIYTVESFKDAMKLVKPGGILTVTFYPITAWQTVRVYKTLSEAVGYAPVGAFSKNNRGLTFIVGNDQELWKQRAQAAGLELFDRKKQEKLMAGELATWDGICVTTDDWPFLFLRQRGLALSYGAGLFFTLFIGWRLVRRSFGAYANDPVGRNMFFLGAAFMLVEVKSISQMGLIVGTTWLVNAAVIGAILLMILFANLGQMKLQAKRVDYLYYGLFASLVASYCLSLSLLNTLPFATRVILGAIILAMPMFFASWIFAITFFAVRYPQRALGMNLLGTLVGGALEYLSMILGISALNLIALALYFCAYLYYKKGAKAAAEGKSGEAVEAS